MTNEKLFGLEQRKCKGDWTWTQGRGMESGVVFPKSQDEDIKRREKRVNGAGWMVGSGFYQHIPSNKIQY